MADPITRPNGSVYRPRKIVALPVDAGQSDSADSVVVFGTHDLDRAKVLADRWIVSQIDSGCEAYDGKRVWWRDGMEGGHRTFVTDPERGRAGVYFQIGDKIANPEGGLTASG